jgi:gas vesicle protein
MRDDELPPAVRRLRELQDEMDEVVEEVGDETDMAMEAVQTYLSQEGADESDDVTAFRAWADEALDDPLRSAVMSALDSFMDGNEDGAEMSVGDFTEWASGTGDESGDESGTTPEEPESPEELQDEEGDSPEAPEGDGGDGGDGGPGPDEETVKEVADTMEAVAETVKQTSETLKKEVDENADAVEELRATLAGIEKRLSDIADESEPRTLSGEGASEEDRMPESTVPKPRRTTDGYIQR